MNFFKSLGLMFQDDHWKLVFQFEAHEVQKQLRKPFQSRFIGGMSIFELAILNGIFAPKEADICIQIHITNFQSKVLRDVYKMRHI